MNKELTPATVIILFFIVTVGIWVPFSQTEITPAVFLAGVIFETLILYQLLSN